MPTIRFCGVKENDYLPAQLAEEEADLYCRLYSEDDLDCADNIERTCLPLWPAAVACAGGLGWVVWMLN